jgi:hypothetical protein
MSENTMVQENIMTPQTYKEQDFEEQISKKNYYHIFIEAATPNHILPVVSL